MTRRTPSLRILKMASFVAIALAPALCLGGVLKQVSPTPTTYVAGTDFLTMIWSGGGNATAPITPVDLLLPPTGGSTSGCEAADFAGFPAGNIALIQRGTCAFFTKAFNAQAAGAAGVIIFNEGNTPGRQPVFAGTLGAPGVSIPVVGTSFFVGRDLYNQSLGGSVVMSILESGNPGEMWVGLKNSDSVGLRVDLAVDVLTDDGTEIYTGFLANQTTGSSGFNNALLKTLDLVGTEVTPLPHIKTVIVAARRTCFGTGHNNGIVRLWYNGKSVDSGSARDAGSRIDATLGGVAGNYYLRDNFALDLAAGTSRLSADATLDSKSPCTDGVSLDRPFTVLGTWTLP